MERDGEGPLPPWTPCLELYMRFQSLGSATLLGSQSDTYTELANKK